MLRRAGEILAYFEAQSLDRESQAYLKYHYLRYEFLLNKIDQIVARVQGELGDSPPRILDVGPAFQTEILRKTLPTAIVNSLGFRDPRFEPRPQDRHYQFNLNDAQFPECWPAIDGHDLVVMAEVIEHLYTFPGLVLRCAATWLREGGYLIIQTPNACALHKRIKMLIGQNPYDMIRETGDNPGHFREYTVTELFSIVSGAGYRPIEWTTANYFDNGTPGHRAYNRLARVLPLSLRQGITMISRKESKDGARNG